MEGGLAAVKDWVYGFFMAWGMFLSIPCPHKIWSESARRKMLACLPLVGFVVGGVWVLCALIGEWLPRPLRAALLAAAPWLVTGFLHLDGFMDVCDAVLSRRDLPRRQEILKDSHCGAFAVISLVLLALFQWSGFLGAEHVALLPLALLPVASRGCAALAVLTLRPMRTSQYSAMERGGAPVVFAAVVTALTIAAGLWQGSIAPLVTAAAYWLAAWYGFRQLDGMSGDVSGFAMTVAELCGVLTLPVWR